MGEEIGISLVTFFEKDLVNYFILCYECTCE